MGAVILHAPLHGLRHSIDRCVWPQEAKEVEAAPQEPAVRAEQLRHSAPVVAFQWCHGDLYSGMPCLLQTLTYGFVSYHFCTSASGPYCILSGGMLKPG